MNGQRGIARPGRLSRVDQRILELQAELREERRLRAAAERNATNFHALLIAERVSKIGAVPKAQPVPGISPTQEGIGNLFVVVPSASEGRAAPTPNTNDPTRKPSWASAGGVDRR